MFEGLYLCVPAVPVLALWRACRVRPPLPLSPRARKFPRALVYPEYLRTLPGLCPLAPRRGSAPAPWRGLRPLHPHAHLLSPPSPFSPFPSFLFVPRFGVARGWSWGKFGLKLGLVWAEVRVSLVRVRVRKALLG